MIETLWSLRLETLRFATRAGTRSPASSHVATYTSHGSTVLRCVAVLARHEPPPRGSNCTVTCGRVPARVSTTASMRTRTDSGGVFAFSDYAFRLWGRCSIGCCLTPTGASTSQTGCGSLRVRAPPVSCAEAGLCFGLAHAAAVVVATALGSRRTTGPKEWAALRFRLLSSPL